MDDTAKQNQSSTPVSKPTSGDDNLQHESQTPNPPTAPGEPVTISINHEQEPVIVSKTDVEHMTDSEIAAEEKEVEKEIEEMVEKSPVEKTPVLDDEVQKAGVTVTDSEISIPDAKQASV